jgi:predicted secreted hydrolase
MCRLTAALVMAWIWSASAVPAISDPSTANPKDHNAYFDAVIPDHPFSFPRDYGSHPAFRTEWWYVTGWLTTNQGKSLGFQITFFRTNTGVAGDNPSSFAPRQLLIAHCALSDAKRGQLWQDQRIRRAGLGLAEAAVQDTDVWADDWSLKRESGVYNAKIVADQFGINLQFETTQDPMANGLGGFSRKGPSLQSASYYYSVPHLKVTGTIARQGRADPVSGEAWLDHEWSSEYLDSEAVGWDWIGINLDDGGALMAFRIRDSHGNSRWAGGTLRDAGGQVKVFGPADIEFRPRRRWVSPRTATAYPVQELIHVGSREFTLDPLIDDQENDTRLTTGAIYWEGAVTAHEGNRVIGRGYLELTGYGDRLRLR